MAQTFKTAAMNLRITPELKAAAEQAARNDHRTLTSWVEKLMIDALKREGIAPSGGK